MQFVKDDLKSILAILKSHNNLDNIPFADLVFIHNSLCMLAQIFGSEAGKVVCDKLSSVLPGITYSVGSEETGVDTVCFYCNAPSEGGSVSFCDIVEAVIPDFSVDTPFGLDVSVDKAKEISAILCSLIEGGVTSS